MGTDRLIEGDINSDKKGRENAERDSAVHKERARNWRNAFATVMPFAAFILIGMGVAHHAERRDLERQVAAERDATERARELCVAGERLVPQLVDPSDGWYRSNVGPWKKRGAWTGPLCSTSGGLCRVDQDGISFIVTAEINRAALPNDQLAQVLFDSAYDKQPTVVCTGQNARAKAWEDSERAFLYPWQIQQQGFGEVGFVIRARREAASGRYVFKCLVLP